MKIAEEIYQRAQHLPADIAQEVLDFIGYLEIKHELSADRMQSRQPPRPTDSHRQEIPNDPVWNELLFNRPPRY